jgi:hypothetical protein
MFFIVFFMYARVLSNHCSLFFPGKSPMWVMISDPIAKALLSMRNFAILIVNFYYFQKCCRGEVNSLGICQN